MNRPMSSARLAWCRAIVVLFALVPLGCGRGASGQPGGVPPADGACTVEFGPTEKVSYRDGGCPQADQLGQFLAGIGFFNGRSASSAEVRRAGTGWSVHVTLGGPGWAAPGFQAAWRNWYAPSAAAAVFPGESVEVALCDERGEPQVRIAVPPSGAVVTDANRFVLYHEPHRDKAERLNAGLAAMGPAGPPRWSFLVARDATGWVLTTPRGSDELPPSQERVYREMRADFARAPFDGGPLKLVVLDARMQSRWTFAD